MFTQVLFLAGNQGNKKKISPIHAIPKYVPDFNGDEKKEVSCIQKM